MLSLAAKEHCRRSRCAVRGLPRLRIIGLKECLEPETVTVNLPGRDSVSAAEPGSVHDITAACIHALPGLYRAAAAGLPTLAGPGYEGAGIGIHIPVK